jgi:hypothetical protein
MQIMQDDSKYNNLYYKNTLWIFSIIIFSYKLEFVGSVSY